MGDPGQIFEDSPETGSEAANKWNKLTQLISTTNLLQNKYVAILLNIFYVRDTVSN